MFANARERQRQQTSDDHFRQYSIDCIKEYFLFELVDFEAFQLQTWSNVGV